MTNSTGSGWEPSGDSVASSDFRWYKVRPGKGLDVVVLSEEPLWYQGHYHQGRMHLCAGTDCRYCADQIGAQTRYCLAVAEVSTRRPGLLEMGRTVALEVRDLADRRGGLRGLRIFIAKHSNSRHSRMEVEQVSDTQEKWWMFLPVPDVKRALELTWEKDGVTLPRSAKETAKDEALRKFKRPATG